MKTVFQKTVNIKYEKLLCGVQGNKTLDILLKKLKHQMVESMSSSTADALGLSRAILCNDSLVKKLEELERTEFMYNGLIDHTRRMLRAYFDVFLVYKGKKYVINQRYFQMMCFKLFEIGKLSKFCAKICNFY